VAAFALRALSPLSICEPTDTRNGAFPRSGGTVAISGPLGATVADAGRVLVWTGVDCAAYIVFKQPVMPSADERDVAVGAGGSFSATEKGSKDREFTVWEFHGQQFRVLKVGGSVVHIGPEEQEWIAQMVQEFVRREGYHAAERAQRIVQTRGIGGLLDEAERIPQGSIQATYLAAGFAAVSRVQDRRSFVHRALEVLTDQEGRTRFFLFIPPAWRGEDLVADVYRAAMVIQSDALVEEVITGMEPPRPLPPALRAPLDSLIGTLNNPERRQALRSRYLDVKP
jgi:hypothetical protein